MPFGALTAPESGWSTEALVNSPLKRTPLHDAHVKAGARMVPFGGWDMPVQYAGIVEEHRTVRTSVGLFDVSHMGEFEVDGPQALAAVQSLTTNDASALDIGQVQYSVLCYPDGGIVDDLTVYRLGAERYMLTVNAGNIDKDWEWVTTQAGGARWRNVSAETGLIAVQGPKAEALVGALTERDVTAIGYYRFVHGAVGGVHTLISRTGYTGEDGCELLTTAEDGADLWDRVLERGAVPCGLGARDTLRLEVCYPLHGNDITPETDAISAGLAWCCKLDKEFTGVQRLREIKAQGPERKLVPFVMEEKAVPRRGMAIEGGGQVTSGTHSPMLDRGIGLGYLPAAVAAGVGSELSIDVRGRSRRARIVKKPIYQREESR